MKKTRFILSLTLVALALPSLSYALTGREVMDEQKRRHESTTEKEVINMILMDKGGKKETRTMIRINKKGDGGFFKYLARFEAPANVRGVTLLTHEKSDEDDQWLYMPAQGKKLKRIAGNSKKAYFMGTDFTYEDLGGDKLNDFNFKILREEEYGKSKDKCWVIEATPANARVEKSSGYSKRELWIKQDDYTTLQTQYYDRSGKLLKVGTSYKFSTIKDKMMRAKVIQMQHEQTGHRTVMNVKERKVGDTVEDDTFTERTVLSFE